MTHYAFIRLTLRIVSRSDDATQQYCKLVRLPSFRPSFSLQQRFPQRLLEIQSLHHHQTEQEFGENGLIEMPDKEVWLGHRGENLWCLGTVKTNMGVKGRECILFGLSCNMCDAADDDDDDAVPASALLLVQTNKNTKCHVLMREMGYFGMCNLKCVVRGHAWVMEIGL